MVIIYTLNLSDQAIGIINLAPLTFGSPIEPLKALGDLRGKPPGAAILYIVAHGVPGGLRIGSTVMLEADLAAQLKALRGTEPTLVVFDSCFAESLRQGVGVEWGPNFGLIFSCRAYERTWHSGDVPPKRVSLFSRTLNAAIEACRDHEDFWSALQAHLLAHYEGLQHPSVDVPDTLSAEEFGLEPTLARAAQ